MQGRTKKKGLPKKQSDGRTLGLDPQLKAWTVLPIFSRTSARFRRCGTGPETRIAKELDAAALQRASLRKRGQQATIGRGKRCFYYGAGG
jgi:hypothetical protein